jgi:hypothetical protein
MSLDGRWRLLEREEYLTRDTANRDFEMLVKAGIAVRMGAGRSTAYLLRNRK